MRHNRKHALENFLPEIAVDLSSPGRLDPQALFGGGVSEVWLEIGAGNGEHAVWQAAQNPSVGIIAVEPFMNGVANLVAEVHERGLKNVRVLADDARLLLERLEPGAINRTFILFPDPWPKRRHWRRRIICMDVLDQLAAAMPAGAELRVGTDHEDYLVWMLRVLRSHPKFIWQAESADDWRNRPKDWPETRFEEKGWAVGRASTYLSLRRI
jgi:tRNA (guanine-N7-)-methyltransferase